MKGRITFGEMNFFSRRSESTILCRFAIDCQFFDRVWFKNSSRMVHKLDHQHNDCQIQVLRIASQDHESQLPIEGARYKVSPYSQPLRVGSLIYAFNSGRLVILPFLASHSIRVLKRCASTPNRMISVSFAAYLKFDPGSGPSSLIALSHSRNGPPFTRAIVCSGGFSRQEKKPCGQNTRNSFLRGICSAGPWVNCGLLRPPSRADIGSLSNSEHG